MAFNKIKYTMGLVYFYAKNRKLIQQEINATLLMYNVSEAVINIRLYLRNKLKEKELVSRIKKFLVPQRPERSFKRAIKPKSCKSLNYRTS